MRWGGAMHGQAGRAPASQPLSSGCTFPLRPSWRQTPSKRPQPSGCQSRPPAMAARTPAGTSHDASRGRATLTLADLPGSVITHALGFLDFEERCVGGPPAVQIMLEAVRESWSMSPKPQRSARLPPPLTAPPPALPQAAHRARLQALCGAVRQPRAAEGSRRGP